MLSSRDSTRLTHTNFPVLLRTTKLAQSTSQYNFLLQNLHTVPPSITLYDKACTKYFPVLLRTTKLAQSTSQYNFLLQNLHTVPPSITLYDKACTKYFPVLLRTTKLAQSTSQYNFLLQYLHKVPPSISLYDKACTKYFPVLLRTRKLAQSTSQHYYVLMRMDCDRSLTIAFFPRFLTIEPHCVRRGCISWRLVGTAPRLKREIEKKEGEEGKRATGQEDKM